MSLPFRKTLTAMASLLFGLGLSTASATNTAATERERYERTDHVSAGVGGIGAPAAQGGGVGSITLAGVSGTVTRAWLYWEGIDIESPPSYTGGNFDYDEADILLDGVPLTGVRAATGGYNNCWPDEEPPAAEARSAVLWRADVTSQVIAKGNGSYALGGLADGAGHSANGASLIVFYNDADTANDRKVVLYDSMISNLDPEFGPELTLPIDYEGGNAIVELHVADGQSVVSDGRLEFHISPGVPPSGSDNVLRFSGAIDGIGLWAGQTVPVMGLGRTSIGDGLWDIRQFDISGSLGSPKTYQTRAVLGEVDCVSSVVELVSLPAGPQPTLMTPNPHDFGDVVIGTSSAPQRFTLTNNQTRTLQIKGAPSTSSTLNQITASTCTDELLLDPGASCTIDATCRPDAFVEYRGTALITRYQVVGAVGADASAYAELFCSGTPAASFARLSFTDPVPRQNPEPIDFGSVLEGSGETVTRRLVLTSTGTAPVRAESLAAAGAGNAAYFRPGAETCTGRTLAPGQTCTVDAVFAPTPANSGTGATLTGSLFVTWTDTSGDNRANAGANLSASVTPLAGPALYLDPLLRDYGEHAVGAQSGSLQFFVRNYGDTPLTITASIAGSHPGDFVFVADGCTGRTLAVNAACTMNPRFAPQATGPRSAQLSVSGVTAGGVTVTPAPSELTGTGTGGAPAPSAGRIEFGSPGSYSVGEAGGMFQVPVLRLDGDAGAVSVTVTTANGSATAGADYTAVSSVVSFADGVSGTRLVTVPISNDSLVEGDESLQLVLGSFTGGASAGGASTAALTIIDDDVVPTPRPGSLQLSASSYAIAEAGGALLVTITRSGGSEGAASVSYATTDGSATAGSDYSAASGQLDWADGDGAAKTVSIPVLDDATVEPDETLGFALAGASGATLGAPAIATLTLSNDDAMVPAATGTLAFSSASYTVGEGAGSAMVTVTRSGGSAGAASLTYATSNGSAADGADYIATTGQLTWADGDMAPKNFSVSLLQDTADEPEETVNLQLGNASGASLGDLGSAILRISDDDDASPTPLTPVIVKGSAGGGSFGSTALLGLLALAGWRRLRRSASSGPRLAALLIGLAATCGLPARALDLDFEHSYFGVRAGIGDYRQSGADLSRKLQGRGHQVTVDLDDHKPAGVLYVGVPFYQDLALELGVFELGKYPVAISGSSATPEALAGDLAEVLEPAGRGVSLGFGGAVPVWGRLSVAPHIAATYYRAEQSARSEAGTVKVKDSGLGVDVGMALMLHLGGGLHFGVAVDAFQQGGEGQVLLLGGQLEYRLGR